MEARNITIVSSRTQSRKTIVSSAETLGQLKADLDRAHIEYSGLAFFEGISKTEMKDNDAILPKNLDWKGSKTNDLIFMLTEPQKRIRNGAPITSRTEAYVYIKAHGLQAEVEKTLGSNFTRCKTPDLVAFCNKKATPKATKPAVHKPVRSGQTKVATASVAPKAPTSSEDNLDLGGLVNLLVQKGVISAAEAMTGTPDAVSTAEFTDSDIQNMFRNR